MQAFDKRVEEYAAKYLKPSKTGAKRSRSIANISLPHPNVLTRKRKRLNESLMNLTLDQTESENQTFDVIPEDATFVITDDNNNKVSKRIVRKKNGNRDGTPLSSMLDESDASDKTLNKGAKPKRLADITNMKKANDSDDDIDRTFKIPTRPLHHAQGSKSLIEKKLITFDDLHTDDDSDNESSLDKRQQLIPKWSLNIKQNNPLRAKQAFVNFEGNWNVESKIPIELILFLIHFSR